MVTADTNIIFYALQQDQRTQIAEACLERVSFLSVQVLNEYANAARRKLRYPWQEIHKDIELLRQSVPDIKSVDANANAIGLRMAERYQLAFYDALIVAVALANGATTLYSEDMQHGLVIDDRLTITNPFLEAA